MYKRGIKYEIMIFALQELMNWQIYFKSKITWNTENHNWKLLVDRLANFQVRQRGQMLIKL